jgi:hypothetical protein
MHSCVRTTVTANYTRLNTQDCSKLLNFVPSENPCNGAELERLVQFRRSTAPVISSRSPSPLPKRARKVAAQAFSPTVQHDVQEDESPAQSTRSRKARSKAESPAESKSIVKLYTQPKPKRKRNRQARSPHVQQDPLGSSVLMPDLICNIATLTRSVKILETALTAPSHSVSSIPMPTILNSVPGMLSPTSVASSSSYVPSPGSQFTFVFNAGH